MLTYIWINAAKRLIAAISSPVPGSRLLAIGAPRPGQTTAALAGQLQELEHRAQRLVMAHADYLSKCNGSYLKILLNNK